MTKHRLTMDVSTVMDCLRELSDSSVKRSQESFAITPSRALGIRVPVLRKLAREMGVNHALACELWQTGIHEARMLAAFTGDPRQVTRELMEQWATDFDSWDICDQTCSALFDKTPFAFQCAVEWAHREEEFVRRAGFALMAALAVHDKKAADEQFEMFFDSILDAADDNRNFVKKAVNWALRQTGKRNMYLHGKALNIAEQIQLRQSASARWIARDAIRELTSEKVCNRLKEKYRK